MPKKKSYLTATDQFCGAGGSSQGAVSAGIDVKLALNHWALAIETHNTNFPNTDHDCTDISASDPRRYQSTDILITSPECTNHSLAKGVKIVQKQMDMFASGKMDPSAERSRATMWDVPRFAEYHDYNAIVVENVVDARKWVMFDSWLHAMYALGYLHKCVYLNSMHCHPTPQSRDRMYVVFWKKGNKAPDLEYTPASWCPKCGKDVQAIQTWKNPEKRFGKYRQQYVYCCPTDGTIVEPYYYAAFNCIDWADPGTRIGDRDKPLADNTVRRIQYGLNKYGSQPMAVTTKFHSEGIEHGARPATDTLRTQCSEQAHAILSPFLVANYSPGYTKPVTDATGAVTTQDHHGICTPFLVDDKHSTGIGYRVRGVDNPVNTLQTDHQPRVVMPFIIKLEHSQGTNRARQVSNEMATQTVRQSAMLCSPGARSSIEPLPTQTTCQGMAFVVENKKNSHARGVDKPLSTATTIGHHGIITNESWHSFISSYYNGGNTCNDASLPIGSATTKDRHAIVSFKKPIIDDCYYRMLKAGEVKLAMAFAASYIVLGSQKDQVKQLGNAVTPPAMEWIIGQVKKSLS